MNAVATPRANGQCERYNRTILNALSCSAAGVAEDLWDTFVKKIQSSLNMTFNTAISTTPLEALAGYKGIGVSEASILNAVQKELDRTSLRELRENISRKMTSDQRKQKVRFDKSRKAPRLYKNGEVVMVMRTDAPCTGTSKKLLAKFKGPFKVTRVLPNDRYEVQDMREGFRKRKTVVSVEKMKPWIILKGKNPYFDERKVLR